MDKNFKFLLDVDITDEQADLGLQNRSSGRTYSYMACGSGGGGGCGGCCGGGRYIEKQTDKEKSRLSIT